MTRITTHPFRRTGLVALLAVLSTLAAAATSLFTAGAEEEFVSGSGKGTAQIVKVGPSAARLALTSTVGLTLADWIGTRARAESRTFDFAALQGTMEQSVPNATKARADNPATSWDDTKGTGPFQLFPNLRIESAEPGAAEGKRWEPAPGVVQAVSARKDPVGRASYRLAGFEIPGLLSLSGGQARSFAGLYARRVDGEEQLIRVAGGTVDIDRVTLLDGLVELRGLRWEGAQITDRNDDTKVEAVGGFTIGRVRAFGQTHKGVELEQARALFDGLNSGLRSLGLLLEPPSLVERAGVVVVSPLRLVVASSLAQPLVDPLQENVIGPLGRQFIEQCAGGGSGSGSSSGGGGSAGGLLGRVDPGLRLASHGAEHEEFREFDNDGPGGRPETTHREDAPPPGGGDSCGVPFLLADLAVAPVSGAGRLDVELGGVVGFTEGALFENPFEGGFGDFTPPPPVGGTEEPPPAPGPTGTPAAPVVTPSGAPAVAGATAGREGGAGPSTVTPPVSGADVEAAPRDVNLRTSPASAVWAVGLAGLGAAMAMALSDYRRIRGRGRAVTPIS